jgi:translation initiation factor IF-1
MDDQKKNESTGIVLEALPNAQFRIQLPDETVILAYLSGKMRMHHIKVLVGDSVSMILDDYRKRGRIIKRL